MTADSSAVLGGLAPGDQIAGYQIQEQIGAGGMAVVYRALDLRLDRQVALKVLSPRLAEDDAFRQRFIRESRASAGVDHPHIIPVFEAGEADGVLFIAMRYVSSGDVRRLILAQGTLSLGRTAAITAQVASALDTAHAHGLVHRDVKPGNMLLDSGGGGDHVYLSDFGLSKYSVAANTLTATGQFMGTLDYVSPEQIQGHPADGRADQYALACTVVEMLSGLPPFKRDESMALLWAQLEAPPPVVTELRPDLPAALDPVIQKALAKSPADRYPTCRAFAAALGEAILAEPARRPAQPLPRPPTALAAVNPPQAAPPPAAAPGGPRLTRPEPVPDMVQPRPAPAPAEAPPPRPQAGQPVRVVRPERPAPGPAQPRRGEPPTPRRPEGHLYPQRQPKRRGGGSALVAVIAVVVVAGLGFVAYRLTHRHAGKPQPTVTVTVPPPGTALAPAETVRAYFHAINVQNYARAWQLDDVVHQRQDYQQFVSGLAGTVRDTVRILSTDGNVVTARLVAIQTTGPTKVFQGTYTVTDGVITATNVQQIAG